MKKLYYIANVRMPTEKAHGIQIMEMCQAFAKEGLEVELWVTNRNSEIKDDPFSYYDIKSNFKIRRLWCMDMVQWGRAGFILETITFSLSLWALAFMKSDIFYTRDEVAALLLKILGKKVSWEAHTGQDNLAIRGLIELDVSIITITKGLKDLYIKMRASENLILVASDAVNLGNFKYLPDRKEARDQLNLPQDKLIIGYIGKYKALGQSKGVEDLISNFPSIQNKFENSYLLLVGINTNEILKIESLLSKNGIRSVDYKIVSHIPHKQTYAYMKASDVLVMSYPNSLHYSKYMSPLKLFEYMASGTPIIASDLPSLREILKEDNANFFNPDDPKNLAEAIEEVLINYKKAEERAAKALEEVRKYSWQKRAEKILNFIE